MQESKVLRYPKISSKWITGDGVISRSRDWLSFLDGRECNGTHWGFDSQVARALRSAEVVSLLFVPVFEIGREKELFSVLMETSLGS